MHSTKNYGGQRDARTKSLFNYPFLYMDYPPQITPEKFHAYENTRRSGVTNMFDIKTVMEFSGLERIECLDIMKNYKRYCEMYPDGPQQIMAI